MVLDERLSLEKYCAHSRGLPHLRQGSVAVCVVGVVIVGISLRGHYDSMYVCWLKRGENSVVPNVWLPRDTRGIARVRPTVLFYCAA